MCLEFGIGQSEDLLLNSPGVEHGWKPVEDEIVIQIHRYFLEQGNTFIQSRIVDC